MKTLAASVLLLVASMPCTADVLYGARITKIFTQSRLDSDAHLIQVDQTLDTACNANRLYIALEDKELFAAALAYYVAEKPINAVFFTNGAPKTVAGHIDGIPCRLTSLF
jgi:hypothetical protein